MDFSKLKPTEAMLLATKRMSTIKPELIGVFHDMNGELLTMRNMVDGFFNVHMTTVGMSDIRGSVPTNINVEANQEILALTEQNLIDDVTTRLVKNAVDKLDENYGIVREIASEHLTVLFAHYMTSYSKVVTDLLSYKEFPKVGKLGPDESMEVSLLTELGRKEVDGPISVYCSIMIKALNKPDTPTHLIVVKPPTAGN